MNPNRVASRDDQRASLTKESGAGYKCAGPPQCFRRQCVTGSSRLITETIPCRWNSDSSRETSPRRTITRQSISPEPEYARGFRSIEATNHLSRIHIRHTSRSNLRLKTNKENPGKISVQYQIILFYDVTVLKMEAASTSGRIWPPSRGLTSDKVKVTECAWSQDLLQKLIVSQLVNKFPGRFPNSRRSVSYMFTAFRTWNLTYATSSEPFLVRRQPQHPEHYRVYGAEQLRCLLGSSFGSWPA